MSRRFKYYSTTERTLYRLALKIVNFWIFLHFIFSIQNVNFSLRKLKGKTNKYHTESLFMPKIRNKVEKMQNICVYLKNIHLIRMQPPDALCNPRYYMFMNCNGETMTFMKRVGKRTSYALSVNNVLK